jgi:hypothetical protein
MSDIYFLFKKVEPICRHIVSNPNDLKMSKKNFVWIKVIFSAVGALGGFLYWKYVGCDSGTCPIQSVWYLSTLWGMAMGYLVGDLSGSFLMKRLSKNE